MVVKFGYKVVGFNSVYMAVSIITTGLLIILICSAQGYKHRLLKWCYLFMDGPPYKTYRGSRIRNT
jgi:hypothetical protein